MTIEEAIKAAIKLEIQVRDVYQDAAESSKDPVGKRIFSLLASEEQGHHDYLKAKLNEWEKNGKISVEELNSAVPSKEDTMAFVNKLKDDMAAEERGGELQMLSKAFDIESKTNDFYKKMTKEMPLEGKQMFSRFVEIEEDHLAIVKAEIDYLTRTGYWFDMKEFDME